MRRSKLVLLALFGLLLSSICASAVTQITLGGTGVYNVTFQGTGTADTIAVSLGTCGISTCSLSGPGYGPGFHSGPYEFISDVNSITLTPINLTAGLWQVNQASDITFNYGTGGSLLAGTLNLLTFSQTPDTKTGTFNSQLDANLAVTGGSLAGLFPSGTGVLSVTLDFRNTTNLANLLNTTNSVQAKLSSGEIPITPEPASMVLIGSALLAVGGFLRRRHLA